MRRVWSSFIHHVRAIERICADLEPAVVVGSVARSDPGAPTDRVRELARFREDPDCWMLVATPQTLGEGILLHQVCIRQVHVDRTFNAGLYLQSLDRTHRLGLEPDVVATASLLIVRGTIDEVVAERLTEKVAVMAGLLDDHDLRVVSLPDEDRTLSPAELLMGEEDVEDLRRLFAHLHAG